MKIEWIGSTDCFKQPTDYHDSPDVYCAMTEEAVWRCARANDKQQLPGLTSWTALACTNRLALRVALATTGLNPKWWPLHIAPGWVKSSSTENVGVGRVINHDAMRELCPEMAEFGVWEANCECDPYELDGWCDDTGMAHILFAASQEWQDTKIISYDRIETRTAFDDLANDVCHALRMRNTPFCFEFRGLDLIDAHCRLPEDPKLKLVWCDPIGDVERCIQAL